MSEYETLKIERFFAAPIQEVWEAWTQPEQFKQWYMPAPFSVPDCAFDLRPGGSLNVSTMSPDGTIMPLTGEFKQVEAPHILVMTNSPQDADGNKLFEIQHSLELTEAEGGTKLTLTSAVIWAAPNTDQYLSGMKPGLEQALDQLQAVVKG